MAEDFIIREDRIPFTEAPPEVQKNFINSPEGAPEFFMRETKIRAKDAPLEVRQELGFEIPNERSETGKGLSIGARQFTQNLAGSVEAFATMFGDAKLAEFGRGIREGRSTEINAIKLKTPKVEDAFNSGDDFLNYVFGTLGQAAPSIASTMGGAAIGAGIGTAIAPGPGTAVGGLVGAGIVSYLLATGEAFAELTEAGVNKEDAAKIAAAVGFPIAALDIIVPTKVAGKLFFKLTKQVFLEGGKKGLRKGLKRVGKEAAKGAGGEALTETGQEILLTGTVAAASDKEFTRAEVLSRLLNAAAAGGLAGGVLRGGVAALPGRRTAPTTPLPPPGTEAEASLVRTGAATNVAGKTNVELSRESTAAAGQPVNVPGPTPDQAAPQPTPVGPTAAPAVAPSEVSAPAPAPASVGEEAVTPISDKVQELIEIQGLQRDVAIKALGDNKGRELAALLDKFHSDPDTLSRPEALQLQKLSKELTPEQVSSLNIGDRIKLLKSQVATEEAVSLKDESLLKELARLGLQTLLAARRQVGARKSKTFVSKNERLLSFAEQVRGRGIDLEVTRQAVINQIQSEGKTSKAQAEELAGKILKLAGLGENIQEAQRPFIPGTVKEVEAVRAHSRFIEGMLKRVGLNVALFNESVASDEVQTRALDALHTDPNLSMEEAVPGKASVKLSGLEASMAQAMEDQLNTWIKKFYPQAKIYMVSALDLQAAGVFGFDVLTAPAGLFNLGDNTYIIKVDTREFTENKLDLRQAVAHEFGHSLVKGFWATVPQSIKNAVQKEYLGWVAKVSRMTWGEYTATYYAVGDARFEKLGEVETINFGKPFLEVVAENRVDLDYILSFDEYVAINFAQREVVDPTVPQSGPAAVYFKRLFAKLKAFFDSVDSTFKPAPILNDWFSLLANELKDPTRLLGGSLQGSKYPGVIIEESMRNIQKIVGDTGRGPDAIRKDVDRFSWWNKSFGSLLEMVNDNPHIVGLQNYMTHVYEWWATKNEFTAMGEGVLKKWRHAFRLDAGMRKKYADFVFALREESEKLGRRLNEQEFFEAVQKHGLNDKAVELFYEMDGTFIRVIETMRENLLNNIDELLGGNPDIPTLMEAQASKDQINQEHDALRKNNYFPRSRFGKYTILIKAKQDMEFEGKAYREGDIVIFETFENKKDRDRRVPTLDALFDETDVRRRAGKLEDVEFGFQGFPVTLLDNLQHSLNLSDNQLNELRRQMVKLRPGPGYKAHMLRSRGIQGFSTDAMRIYTDYMMHAANHIARVKFSTRMLQAQKDIKDSASDLRDSTKRDGIAGAVMSNFKFLMNPGNDLPALRGGLFAFAFAFVPMQVLVNFTQLPVFTYSALSAIHGTPKTVAAMTRATTLMFSVYGKTGNIRASSLPQWKLDAIAEARRFGIIDESMATELAGAASSDALQRMVGELGGPIAGKARRGANLLLRGGLMPFAWSEKMNRYITFLAALDLADKAGESHSQALQTAIKVVSDTQFEYAKFNRFPAARGLAAPVFIFKTYLLGAINFLRKNPGNKRALLMMLLISGVQGLPGAEDLFDLFDFFGTKSKQLFGLKDPRVNVRTWMRKELAEFIENPDYVMHGAARSTFGLHAIGNLFGLPVPGIDFSASTSLGRIIPGTEPILQLLQGELRPDTALSKTTAGLGGFGVSVGMNFFKAIGALSSGDPKKWEVVTRAMPRAIKSIVQFGRSFVEGDAKSFRGDTVIRFDPEDFEEQAELFSFLIGVSPTRLREKQELTWFQKEATNFWLTWRQTTMSAFFTAIISTNRETIADARAAVRRYNSSLPDGFGRLRITSTQLRESVKRRQKGKRLREAGIADQKRLRAIQQDVRGAFPAVR